MKKLLATVICFALLLGCLGVFAAAEEAVKISVFKINPEIYHEGCIALYTSARGETLGTAGQNFAWWTVAVFEPDEASGGYRCISLNATGGEDKSATVIPADGFVIAGNTGNNWPALFADATGDEWYYNGVNSEGVPYKDCPNYATEAVMAEMAKLAALQVGDIMYLNGIDLANATITTNEDGESIFYYSDNFVSSSFLSSVKPETPPVSEDPTEQPTEEPTEEPTEVAIPDTTGWTVIDGKTAGTYQTAIDAGGTDIGSYAYKTAIVDGKYVVEVVYSGKLSGTADSFGNGNGTNIRVWFHAPKNANGEEQLAYNAIVDVAYTGAGVEYRVMPNTVTTGNKADSATYAYNVDKPFMSVTHAASGGDTLYVKIVLDSIPNVPADSEVVGVISVSGKPDGAENNCIHSNTYTEGQGPWSDSTWTGDALVAFAAADVPVEPDVPSEPDEPVKPVDPQSPTTSDAGIATLALISVLALAGAMVIKKTR